MPKITNMTPMKRVMRHWEGSSGSTSPPVTRPCMKGRASRRAHSPLPLISQPGRTSAEHQIPSRVVQRRCRGSQLSRSAKWTQDRPSKARTRRPASQPRPDSLAYVTTSIFRTRAEQRQSFRECDDASEASRPRLRRAPDRLRGGPDAPGSAGGDVAGGREAVAGRGLLTASAVHHLPTLAC